MDKIIWCVGLTQECDSPNPRGGNGAERMVDGEYFFRLFEVVDV
jgi:hypothetical protein